jgi:hypothetical protein
MRRYLGSHPTLPARQPASRADRLAVCILVILKYLEMPVGRKLVPFSMYYDMIHSIRARARGKDGWR